VRTVGITHVLVIVAGTTRSPVRIAVKTDDLVILTGTTHALVGFAKALHIPVKLAVIQNIMVYLVRLQIISLTNVVRQHRRKIGLMPN
jgi:hypothetical protein